MTEAERQALIATIQGQIRQIQGQINQILQQRGGSATPTNSCKAYCITQADGVYAVDCSGNNLTKCASGYNCQQKFSTDYVLVNGVAQTIQTLTGAQCIKTTTSSCSPNWNCQSWSVCANGKQTRACTDSNQCGTTSGRPTISQSCCSADCKTQTDGVYTVSCSGTITKCKTNYICEKTYTTTYENVGGKIQTIKKLNGSRCVCAPSWQTGNWGACSNGSQTRTVTDANNCGTTTNKPATSQTCTQ